MPLPSENGDLFVRAAHGRLVKALTLLIGAKSDLMLASRLKRGETVEGVITMVAEAIELVTEAAVVLPK